MSFMLQGLNIPQTGSIGLQKINKIVSARACVHACVCERWGGGGG